MAEIPSLDHCIFSLAMEKLLALAADCNYFLGCLGNLIGELGGILMHRFLLSVGVAVVCFSAMRVEAALLEYEGFDYPGSLGNSLNTLNGGTGWANAWSDPDNDARLSSSNSSLSYPAGVGFTPIGTSVNLTLTDTSVQAARQLGTPMALATGGQTFYASALFRSSAITGQTATVDFFSNNDGTGNLRWQFGITTAGNFRVAVDPGSATQRADSAFTLAPDTTYFLVAKFRTNTGTSGVDEVFLQIFDPADIVGNEPLTDAGWDLAASGGSSVTLQSIRLTMANGSGQTNSFDEFRVGTTWNDVVNPVPEPGMLGLLAAGIMAAGIGWKRTWRRCV